MLRHYDELAVLEPRRRVVAVETLTNIYRNVGGEDITADTQPHRPKASAASS